MVDRLLAAIAPHSCCSCGNIGSILCPSCKNDIVSDPFSACISCLRPTLDGNLCSTCSAKLGVTLGWCVGERETHLKALLDWYKFNSAKEASKACAELLDMRLPLLPGNVVAVPVPTSPAHRRARGFDHSSLLASRLAKKRKLLFRQVLERRSNDTQHFKARSERLKMSPSELEVIAAVPPRILLIDDIYTTGATLRACIKKLQSAGAEQIYVAIIARQTLDDSSDLW